MAPKLRCSEILNKNYAKNINYFEQIFVRFTWKSVRHVESRKYIYLWTSLGSESKIKSLKEENAHSKYRYMGSTVFVLGFCSADILPLSFSATTSGEHFLPGGATAARSRGKSEEHPPWAPPPLGGGVRGGQL